MIKKVNLTKEVLKNNRKTYLYLVLELLPKRLCIEGYRIVLGKFLKAEYTSDLIAVIAQYEDDLEVSTEKVHVYMCKCIDKAKRVPESVTKCKSAFLKKVD